jgi:hypothetical protein
MLLSYLLLPVASAQVLAQVPLNGPGLVHKEVSTTSLVEIRSIRGITISTYRGGQEWASDEMVGTFEDVARLGANWVALHPYARIEDDGRIGFRPIDRENPPEFLVRPIREAHAAGLKILIKPHLAYWGSGFSWRGEITFDEPEQWQRFFAGYREWIRAVAEVTREADLFAVGTELDQTLGFEGEWRRIIAQVREATPVPLTYAANWTDFKRVGFWDALDLIGVQAYFPVSVVQYPDRAQIEESWRHRMADLADFSRARDRHILFTELGYNRSFSAAQEPWSPAGSVLEAGGLQRLLMDVALRCIEREPRVVGSFLWKWFPRPRSLGPDFQLAYPEMEETLRSVWTVSPSAEADL